MPTEFYVWLPGTNYGSNSKQFRLEVDKPEEVWGARLALRAVYPGHLVATAAELESPPWSEA